MEADWYFDLVSPFCYLQLASFDRLPADLVITPKPILFGAVLKHFGQLGPAEIAPKRVHTYRYCQWLAGRRGIPFRMPPRHPFNPLQAMRLLAALGPTLDQVRTAYDFVFAEGRCTDGDGDFAELAEQLAPGADAGALTSEVSAKQRLRDFTDEAIGRGVFGVPTFHLAGENFWGDDATGMLLDWLDQPRLFERAEMRRLATLPHGAVRAR